MIPTEKKNILIVSNFFYPEKKPRAFRATELAKGFCAKGYSVNIILPNKEIFRNYPLILDNLTVIYTDEKLIRNNSSSQSTSNNTALYKIKRLIKKIIFYFLPSEIFFDYNHNITKKIIQVTKKYDKVISISHPLSIHLSVVMGKWFNKKLKGSTTIAEFSDPMFKGDYKNVFPLNLLFGYIFSWNFDFFVLPISKAVDKFSLFKNIGKIKVIPQGFEINSVRLAGFIKNEEVTFCYAGSFYKGLRDPSYFFEFLKGFNKPYRFELYLSDKDPFRNEILNLNIKPGKIIVNDFIPREELLFELSKKDFLINFENENSSMAPSKLIDYALTNRPILSFNKNTFNAGSFYDFYNGNYKSRIFINVNDFDIHKIIDKFHNL